MIKASKLNLARTVRVGWVALCVLLTTACHLDMYNQPKVDPYQESSFYGDGAASRPPQPNTVARNAEPESPLTTGKENGQFVAKNPVQSSDAVIARGKERYGIACVQCHGPLLNGKGPVASYFKPAPASFYAQYLKDAPDGYIFNVITHGKGQMFPQAQTLSVEDRWAVIAYIRSLENNPPKELSEKDRQPTQYPPTFRVPGTAQPDQPELPSN